MPPLIALVLCSILLQEQVRVVQTTPQHMVEVQTYEWCVQMVGGVNEEMSLVKRTFWVIDGKPTRNEMSDTPSSHSSVLWEHKRTEAD